MNNASIHVHQNPIAALKRRKLVLDTDLEGRKLRQIAGSNVGATFHYSEALFAEQTRLSRGDAKFLRDQHLREGIDWKKEGGEIVLSASAIKCLWRKLEGRPASFDLSRCLLVAPQKRNGAAEKNGAPILLGSATWPIARKMSVFAIPLNPMVVRATDERGSHELVWVGRNATFVAARRTVATRLQVSENKYEQTTPISDRQLERIFREQ